MLRGLNLAMSRPETPRDALEPSRLRGWELAAPLALGALLRFWGLSSQVPGGDELHALRAAAARPLADLLTSYQAPDIYVPMAAATHLLLRAGVTVTETWLRLPGLVAGLLALVLLPRLAERALGASAARALAWLLALCPSLVIYSRIARSYMPLVLFATAAALAFFHWWERGRRRDAALYAGLGTTAVFFHPVAAPVIAAPLALAGLEALARRDGRRLLRLSGVAAALGLGLLLAVGPAHESLERLASTRRVPLDFDAASFTGLALLHAGTSQPLAGALVWLAALAGWLLLFHRNRRFALFSAGLWGAQIAGVLLISPVGADQPLLFGRYALLALPWMLCWLAFALAALAAALAPRIGVRPARLAAALLLLGWWASSPLATRTFRQSSFVHHNDFVDWSCPRAELDPAAIPSLYRSLAAAPGREPILEIPWQPAWRFGRALPLYQEIHRRPVLVARREPAFEGAAIRLQHLLPMAEGSWLASSARWLVLHRDLAREEARLALPACAARGGATMPEALAAALRGEAEALRTRLEAAWGAPDSADTEVTVWDLEAVRARLSRSGGSPPSAR